MNDSRIARLGQSFEDLYGVKPTAASEAPGRAEILGCHTDYNYGFALAAGIGETTICLAAKTTQPTVSVFSSAYPSEKPATFALDDIKRDNKTTWTNYIRAVVKELGRAKYQLGGAQLFIDSTVPKSGGVSSSAALELAVAYALLALYGHRIDKTSIALLCKLAENSPIVKSPCGFLDQGASAFAQKDALVLLDFLPRGKSPVSKIEVIPAQFSHVATFVIPVDSSLERQLGETGYVVRRKMCEDSLAFWEEKLNKPIGSLRDVTVSDFQTHRDELERRNPVMRKRVEHIVMENERVLAATHALGNHDIQKFGQLLTAAGKSSLELYELDENTPQLTFLVSKGRTIPGVIGMRNMGGGFSAIALALIEGGKVESWKSALSTAYRKKFRRELSFIEFTPSDGAHVLYA